MEEDTKDTTDRFSLLPDFIVHHILSYLLYDPKSRVRMSVLSKEWFALTAAFPMLYFHQYRLLNHMFSDDYDVEDERVMEKFCKYVQSTVSRFCKQNISAHTLYIYADLINLEQVEFFGRCLDLVLEKGLEVMHIRFYHQPHLSMIRLPNTLLSASSLTSLTLSSCELPSYLMAGVVKFKSLRLLSLSFLPINEGVIEYLTLSCPLLEEIYLRFCYGFKTVCIKMHQNLLKVVISCKIRFPLERIDVEAPNLIYFLLECGYSDEAPSMLLGSCKKLRTFSYDGSPLKRLDDFLSTFPFMENLWLTLPSHVNSLKLSNHSLRKIRLISKCDLEEIDLNTPSLLSFESYGRCYDANIKPLLRKCSYLFKGCMKCVIRDSFGILWCEKLRKFLEKNSIFKVLKLLIYSKLIDVEESKLIQSPPYEIEHVEIMNRLNKRSLAVYVASVDVVLCCCRPRSLTLELYHYIDIGHVVKYAYEKLLRQENEDQTNIKFVLFTYSEDKKHFSDLNSLLKRLSRDQAFSKRYGDKSKSIITFIKEEVVQEAE